MTIESKEQAESLLKELSKFYKEPVMPIGRYCAGLQQWQTCMQQRADDSLHERYGDPIDWNRYNVDRKEGKHDPDGYVAAAESVNWVFLQIRKSSLLDRILYAGQEPRKVKCPEHKGHWVGLEHDQHYCKHGCHFLGWLPDTPDPWPPGVFIWTTAKGSYLAKDGMPYTPAPGEPTLEEWRAREK